MGVALARAALSPNIKERRDYSCALFDARGRLVAQAAHIPVHLGSTALSVAAVLETVALGDGDVAIVERPVRRRHAPARHHAGAAGVRRRRVHRLRRQSRASRRRRRQRAGVDAGRRARARRHDARGARAAGGDVAALRDGAEPVAGDARGHHRRRRAAPRAAAARRRGGGAAVRGGARARGAARRSRWRSGRRSRSAAGACRRWQRPTAPTCWRARADALIAYSEALLRAAIAAVPDGVYAFADSLDDDGAGRDDVGIRVTLTIDGDRAIVDFSDSDEEVDGPLNAVYAVTLSAVVYAFRLLLARGGADQPRAVRAARGHRARRLACWRRARRARWRRATSRPRSAWSTWCSARWRRRCPSASRRRARARCRTCSSATTSAPTTRPSAAAPAPGRARRARARCRRT